MLNVVQTMKLVSERVQKHQEEKKMLFISVSEEFKATI